MTSQTVIVLSKQHPNLGELVDPTRNVVLAPHCDIDVAMASGDLMELLRNLMEKLIRTPEYKLDDPVFVIVNSTAQGLAAAMYIKGYYNNTGNTVHTWVLLDTEGTRGKYVALEQSYMEGYDQGQRHNALSRFLLNAIPSKPE